MIKTKDHVLKVLLAALGAFFSLLLFSVGKDISDPRFIIKYEEKPSSADIQIVCCRNVARNVNVLISSVNEIIGTDVQLRPPYQEVKVIEKTGSRVSVNLARMNSLPTSKPEPPGGLFFHMRFKDKKNKEKPFVDYVLVTADNGEDYVILPQKKAQMIIQIIRKCYPIEEAILLLFAVIVYGKLWKAITRNGIG